MPMTDEELKVFHQQRMSGLGGTDAAIIMGVNKWRSPIQVWREKVGMETKNPDNDVMEFGREYEPTLVDRAKRLIEDRSGGKLTVVPGGFISHPEHPFLIGHLDGMIITANNGSIPQGIVEAKTVGPYSEDDWGEDWTDEVPDSYLVQVQHYLGLTELRECYLMAFFRGSAKKRIYRIDRNDRLIKSIFEEEIKFWNDYVVTQESPPIDGSEASAKFLRELYPTDSGEVKQADPDILGDVLELKEITQILKRYEGTKLLFQNKIKDFMGDASVLEFEDGKITWKTTKDSEKVDYKAAVDSIWGDLPMMWQKVLNEAIQANTKTVPGSRRFVVPRSWSKVEEE